MFVLALFVEYLSKFVFADYCLMLTAVELILNYQVVVLINHQNHHYLMNFSVFDVQLMNRRVFSVKENN
jgi:hypothetical protein